MTLFGSPLYDPNTDFTGTGFDPVAAGWTFVPEPDTALFLGLGLAALAARKLNTGGSYFRGAPRPPGRPRDNGSSL